MGSTLVYINVRASCIGGFCNCDFSVRANAIDAFVIETQVQEPIPSVVH